MRYKKGHRHFPCGLSYYSANCTPSSNKSGQKLRDVAPLKVQAKVLGVKFDGNWTDRNKSVVIEASWDVAEALARETDKSTAKSFRDVYDGGINFKWCGDACVKGGLTRDANNIEFGSLPEPRDGLSAELAHTDARNNVVHELGHAFAWKWAGSDNPYGRGPASSIPSHLIDKRGYYPSPDAAPFTWQQHPCGGRGNPKCAGENFSDMFLGWTYGKWAKGRYGRDREKFMNDNMPGWVDTLVD